MNNKSAFFLLALTLNSWSCLASEPVPQRIIALSPHAVELLFVLGVGERIVATSDFADYPEAAKAILKIGGYDGIQIEKVLELKPDLVIAWEGGKEQDIVQMEQLGLKVHRNVTRSLADVPKQLIEFGVLVGEPARGEVAAAEFETRLMALRVSHQTKKPVTFFYQLWSEPLRTMAAGSWINEVMTGCGGVNVFNEETLDYPQVSMESVLIKAPEVIVVPSHHGTVAGTAELWKKWPEIPAVKNGHIFMVDGDLLHRLSVRILDGMEQVCEMFDRVRADVGSDPSKKTLGSDPQTNR